MVTAALKFAEKNKEIVSYPTADEARIDILNSLSFCEAHDQYQWPDFSKLHFDFDQTMRLRRSLVNNVFIALQRSGNINIVVSAESVGTPESRAEGVAEDCAPGKDTCCRFSISMVLTV